MAPRVPRHAPLARGKTKAEKRCPHVNQLFLANTTAINPSKMTNPPIHITPHNLTLSPALQQFIRRKMSALSRFAGDMLAAEIILRGKPGAPYPFSLSARLALPGRDIQGNAVHENLYTAIDQLVAKLARLSRKRKTRLAKKFKRARRPPAVDSKGQSPTLDFFAPLKSKSRQAPQYCAAKRESAGTTRPGRTRGGG
jgi:ribosomal subunit interface protein